MNKGKSFNTKCSINDGKYKTFQITIHNDYLIMQPDNTTEKIPLLCYKIKRAKTIILNEDKDQIRISFQADKKHFLFQVDMDWHQFSSHYFDLARMSVSPLSHSIFHKIKKLGKGGYSTVYLACFVKDSSRCALKIIEKKIINLQNLTLQIKMEIEALKKIVSPMIPYLYGIYNSSNYLVMHQEYIPGTTLRVAMKKAMYVDIDQCFEIAWRL